MKPEASPPIVPTPDQIKRLQEFNAEMKAVNARRRAAVTALSLADNDLNRLKFELNVYLHHVILKEPIKKAG